MRTLLAANALSLNVSLLVCSRVQLGAVDASVVSAHAAESTGKGAVARTGALHSKGLSHNGAALAEYLEVRHASSAGRNIVAGSRGRERAKRGGGRLMKEWAHSPRLAEKGLHDDQWGGQANVEGGWLLQMCGKASVGVRQLGRERMVGGVLGCADTNHFICGIESQTKRPASASNGRAVIGSLPLEHADTIHLA